MNRLIKLRLAIVLSLLSQAGVSLAQEASDNAANKASDKATDKAVPGQPPQSAPASVAQTPTPVGPANNPAAVEPASTAPLQSPELQAAPEVNSDVAVAPSESPAASTEAPVAPAAAESDTSPKFDIGGGVTLYYYQPTKGSGKGDVSIYFANLLLDGHWNRFALHIEPRFRDTKLRPYYDSSVWLQEAYASATAGPVVVKVGKVYKRSGGLFWDNSFYGNVQVYDGLKLDPNFGLSVEGSVGDKLGLDFAAQYFIVDGRTNVSQQGRDTISIPGARRRHTLAARVEPWIKPNSQVDIRLGLSGERFTADIPNEKHNVGRFAGDVKATFTSSEAGKGGIWGEFVYQKGKHVIDHPSTGLSSGKVSYFLVGAEYSVWRLTARYNVSYANYQGTGTKETLHVPALAVSINDHIAVLGEYAVWRQKTPTSTVPYDTSLNLTLSGHF